MMKMLTSPCCKSIRKKTKTWLRQDSSFLSQKTFNVSINHSSTFFAPLSCGVPQGSILVPVLFSIYLLLLVQTIPNHITSMQTTHKSTLPLSPVTITIYMTSVSVFKILNGHKLPLTQWKKWGNNNNSLQHLTVFLLIWSTISLHKTLCKNFGDMFNSDLKFDKQLNQVVKVRVMQLCITTKQTNSPYPCSKEVIHSFISSHLGYCSSLYFGITHSYSS